MRKVAFFHPRHRFLPQFGWEGQNLQPVDEGGLTDHVSPVFHRFFFDDYGRRFALLNWPADIVIAAFITVFADASVDIAKSARPARGRPTHFARFRKVASHHVRTFRPSSDSSGWRNGPFSFQYIGSNIARPQRPKIEVSAMDSLPIRLYNSARETAPSSRIFSNVLAQLPALSFGNEIAMSIPFSWALDFTSRPKKVTPIHGLFSHLSQYPLVNGKSFRLPSGCQAPGPRGKRLHNKQNMIAAGPVNFIYYHCDGARGEL